ncbi:MAG: D-alanine--D-alanine ligase family protein [Candidatus Muiribacteriaceae bacterium]
MKIGITFDLKDFYIRKGYSKEEVAEFDSEETIKGIESAILNLGVKVDRIGNINDLTGRLANGDRWDLVFNIAEGLYGFGRESQVPALLDAYRIPYTFSDPMVLALTLHKGMAKHVIKDFGLNTPDFFIIKKTDELKKLTLDFPLFVKPVAEGTGKGISDRSIVSNIDELKEISNNLIRRFRQPVIIEEYLPGREFTVGIIGTGRKARVAGVIEVIQKDDDPDFVYGYENKADYEKYVEYKSVEEPYYGRCGRLALASWRALECRDAGRVDVRFDRKGKPSFIEVNPLAGLNHIHSDLPILCHKYGMSFNRLICEIIQSAVVRVSSRKYKDHIRSFDPCEIE